MSARIRLGLAVLAAASLLAACSADPGSGLDGSIGKGTSGGAGTLADMPADYTGFLANHTGQVVVLKSAALLPLHGYRTPRLVHLAVELGLRFAASDIGWPPGAPGLDLVASAEYRVQPGKRVKILYGVVASKLGEYADAGIRVTVLVGGSPATVDVVSYAGTCVLRNLNHDCPDSFYNRIEAESARS